MQFAPQGHTWAPTQGNPLQSLSAQQVPSFGIGLQTFFTHEYSLSSPHAAGSPIAQHGLGGGSMIGQIPISPSPQAR